MLFFWNEENKGAVGGVWESVSEFCSVFACACVRVWVWVPVLASCFETPSTASKRRWKKKIANTHTRRSVSLEEEVLCCRSFKTPFY